MLRRISFLLIGMTVAEVQLLQPLCAGESGFDWDLIGQEMGMDMDEESFDSLQTEMFEGIHPYIIFVNDKEMGEQTVEIVRSDADSTDFVAKLPAMLFQRMPIKRHMVPELMNLPPKTLVFNLAQYLPGAVVVTDTMMQTIYVTIPQIYEEKKERTLLPPSMWNFGQPALRLAYDWDSTYSDKDDGTEKRHFGSFDTMANWGRWRFYSRSTVSKSNEGKADWESLQNYATTILPSWRSRFRIGEFMTSGRYIQGVPILGIELEEDDNQLEPSDRSYLPVINGIASGNSTVTIRQNGRLLRQTDVPPGPFRFDDVRGLGTSGNIEVEVKERNGKTQVFYVPYAVSARLLKTGRFSWGAALGRFYDGVLDEHPEVIQASLGYGMPGGWTLFGGGLYADIFSHVSLGLVADAGQAGVLTANIERSAETEGRKRSGTTVGLLWDKHFDWVNSDFTMEYRHTLEGDVGSLNEAISGKDEMALSTHLMEDDYVEDKLTASLSKSLGKYGSLSGSLFWEKTAQNIKRSNLTFSYGVPYRDMSFTLYGQGLQTEMEAGDTQREWIVSLQMSMPLGAVSSALHNTSLDVGTEWENDGKHSQNLNIKTYMGDDREWQFGFSGKRGNKTDTEFNANVNRSTSVGSGSFNYSQRKSEQSYNVHVNGALMATRDGLFAAETMDGNMAVVHVPGAPKAEAMVGVKTTGEWMLIRLGSDFIEGDVTINPESIPPNMVVLGGMSQRVVPADGAVIPVYFKTYLGYQAYLKLMQNEEETVPFGGLVKIVGIGDNHEPGVTDDEGLVYFQAMPPKGVLDVRWRGKAGIESCRIPYELDTEGMEPTDIIEAELVCQKNWENVLTVAAPTPFPAAKASDGETAEETDAVSTADEGSVDAEAEAEVEPTAPTPEALTEKDGEWFSIEVDSPQKAAETRETLPTEGEASLSPVKSAVAVDADDGWLSIN